MRFLPVFFDLQTGPVVLVGAGPHALAKLGLLQAAGARVKWFSPSADAGEELLIANGTGQGVGLVVGEPSDDDIAEAIAVVSAAGDPVDARIASQARRHHVHVNVVDRPELSTFIVPAIVDRGDVVVAIGTGGTSPVLARRIRERIEAVLPARIGEFATLLQRYRARAVHASPAGGSLRRLWEKVVDGPIAAAFLAGRTREAETALEARLAGIPSQDSKDGTVYLVGAGPGDPDLLTLRALHALQNADAIFYDELVGPEILSRARRDAELVFVGKRKGEPGIGQTEISRRLVDAARGGRNVVRLKGGDSFIFGRGGEELEALRAAGIEPIVVPGITAALGCAAEFGLPLTYRGEATRLSFVTANTLNGPDVIDWKGLGDRATTVVVYMGLSAAAQVRDGLLGDGRSGDTPVAVLARGTLPNSQAVVGRLDDLPRLAATVGRGPALLVIGDVVARSTLWIAAQAEEVAA